MVPFPALADETCCAPHAAVMASGKHRVRVSEKVNEEVKKCLFLLSKAAVGGKFPPSAADARGIQSRQVQVLQGVQRLPISAAATTGREGSDAEERERAGRGDEVA